MSGVPASSGDSRPLSQVGKMWPRLCVTFGPLLVGLVGGAMTGCVGLASMNALFTNIAMTYAKFPSIEPPWLARGLDIPGPLLAGLFVLGFAGPLLMGLVTARLVHSTDVWGDLSAGLMTCLASTLASYAVTLGAAVSIAMVVVPSIADFTLVGELAKTPLQAAAIPSDVLIKRYPELSNLPANERGGAFFEKMIADQAVGSVYGVWLGMALALCSCGVLGLFGTLAGGWILRRGGSWSASLTTYAEVTVSTSWTASSIIMRGWMQPEWSPVSAGGLLIITALVVIGAVRRWNWLLRVNLLLVWLLILWESHRPGANTWPMVVAALVAYVVLACQLGRFWFRNPRRLGIAGVGA